MGERLRWLESMPSSKLFRKFVPILVLRAQNWHSLEIKKGLAEAKPLINMVPQPRVELGTY